MRARRLTIVFLRLYSPYCFCQLCGKGQVWPARLTTDFSSETNARSFQAVFSFLQGLDHPVDHFHLGGAGLAPLQVPDQFGLPIRGHQAIARLPVSLPTSSKWQHHCWR